MGRIARRLRTSGAIPLGCACAVLCPGQANAEASARVFTADTLELSGDLRFVGIDGERGWTEGGFGKLRSGSDHRFRVEPQVGNVALVWKPQFTWSLGATVVGEYQGGQRSEAGLSQAYLTYRPMRSSNFSASARAGLMWPPISFEHEGADWHVRDSVTPSAINSWIGEEVRPVAVETSVSTKVGAHELRGTAAIFAANDTAGTLLTFRGWALHDRTTLAFHRQPLPPLEELSDYQPPFTHPLLDVHRGFAHRPGYYAKLAWQLPVPVRFEVFRYDNRANPEDVNPDFEWGWRTHFNHAAVAADLGGGTELKAQAIDGRTRMGFREPDRRWIDSRFRSAFVMLSRPLGSFGIAARAEAFGVRNSGSLWTREYDEHGWSAMLSGKREFGPLTALVELLHVWSDTPARDHAGEPPRQAQTQAQAQLRMRW